MTEQLHVDDFIDDPSTNRYAASWFEAFRRPAVDKMHYPDQRKLFATFRGSRYRVTGCSRLGDVWLHSNVNEDAGYQHRVNVAECSDWSSDLCSHTEESKPTTPGQVVFTFLLGSVTLVREMKGESSIEGWEVRCVNEKLAYLTNEDFNLTAKDVYDIKRCFAEMKKGRHGSP